MSRNVFLASLSCLRQKCALYLDFLSFASKTFDCLVDCSRFSLELCLVENLNLNNFKLQKRSRTFSIKKRTLSLHADEIWRLPFK